MRLIDSNELLKEIDGLIDRTEGRNEIVAITVQGILNVVKKVVQSCETVHISETFKRGSMTFTQNADGKFEEFAPYAHIICQTKEDYDELIRIVKSKGGDTNDMPGMRTADGETRSSVEKRQQDDDM